MARRCLLLGHRGARGNRSIPENSIPSFAIALAHGCDGFEFDVRRSADGVDVICHDPVYNGLDIGLSKAGDLGLPRVEEVLSLYASRAFLDVELKVAGQEAAIVTFLKKYVPRKGAVVSSFLPEVVKSLAGLDDPPAIGLICETHAQLSIWSKTGCDYVIPHYKLVDERLISQVQDAGKRILVWTVNDPHTMRRLHQWGVDGIVSDETKLLVETVRSGGSQAVTDAV